MGTAWTPPAGTAEAGAKVTVTGRVLRHDGTPAAGAKIFGRRRQGGRFKILGFQHAGTAGRDGRFAVTVPLRLSSWKMEIAATARGTGFGWCTVKPPHNADDYRGLTIRLAKDTAITGRVVNLEGRPMSGAKVSLINVFAPRGDVRNFLNSWFLRSQRRPTGVRSLLLGFRPPGGLHTEAVTGRDGRFTLRGVGKGRVAVIRFAGGGVARCLAVVVTQPGLGLVPYRAAVQKWDNSDTFDGFPPLGLHGPDSAYAVARGRTVFGPITDHDTGEPIDGCPINVVEQGIGMDEPAGRGRYRVDSLPRPATGRYAIIVVPPAGSAYLPRTVYAADDGGFAQIRLPARLRRGAVVTGKLIDAKTGRGVCGRVSVRPAAGNRYVGQDGYPTEPRYESTDPDGTFRILAVPGKSVVADVDSRTVKFGKARLSPYRPAGGVGPKGSAAVARIDAGPVEKATATLRLVRGAEATLRVTDGGDKPVVGAWAFGLTRLRPEAARLPADRATVYALDVQQPRDVLLYHPQRKLAGRMGVRGGSNTVARLRPAATIVGRVVDANGRPVPEARVSYQPTDKALLELYREAHSGGLVTTADAAGRFVLAGAFPKAAFTLWLRRDGRLAAPLGKGTAPGTERRLEMGDLRPR